MAACTYTIFHTLPLVPGCYTGNKLHWSLWQRREPATDDRESDALKPKLYYFYFLWIYRTTSRNKNVQQVCTANP